MLWLWLMVVAHAGTADCDRIAWRASTASAAQAAAGDDDALQDALKRQASISRREDPTCQPAPLADACMAEGVGWATKVGQAALAANEGHDQATRTEAVGTLLERRRQLGKVPPDDEGKLEQRLQAEHAVSELQARWLAAQADWNAARCEGPCAGASSCEAHKGSQRTLDSLRALYTDLLQARTAFFERYDLDTLQARIEAGGASGSQPTMSRARATLLQARLASTPARPVRAQAVLGSLLAAYDGAPELGPDARRTAVAWLAYNRSWHAYKDGLDKQIDTVIAAWVRLDEAENNVSGVAAMSRLQMAMDALGDRAPATPAGPKGS